MQYIGGEGTGRVPTRFSHLKRTVIDVSPTYIDLDIWHANQLMLVLKQNAPRVNALRRKLIDEEHVAVATRPLRQSTVVVKGRSC